jgi:hypothetical protein
MKRFAQVCIGVGIGDAQLVAHVKSDRDQSFSQTVAGGIGANRITAIAGRAATMPIPAKFAV